MRRTDFSYIIFFSFYVKFKITNALLTYEEMQNEIFKNGITSEVIDHNTSNVYINNNSYQIYGYDPEEDQGYLYSVKMITDEHPKRLFYHHTINKLYKCLNCEIAEWTREKLLEIVEPLPLLYQRDFQDTNVNVYDKFCEKSATLFSNLKKYAEIFINILLNYRKIFSSVRDQSIDTENLTSLLSLIYKIKFLYNLCEPKSTVKKSGILIIRILLGATNLFQKYIYLNCALQSSYNNNNKQLFGFLMNKNRKDIHQILADIKPLKLGQTKTCNLGQILLTKIITRNFKKIKWTTNHGDASVKAVIKKIQLSYELPLIVWYQQYMFHTVIKIICIKTKEYFEKNDMMSLSDSDIADFKTIVSIFRDNMDLSAELQKIFSRSIFKLENKNKIKDDDLIIDLTNHIDSLSSIKLEKFDNHVDTDTGSNVFKNRSFTTFQKTIAILTVNVEDLTCFVRIFDYFDHRYRAYKSNLVNDTLKNVVFQKKVSAKSRNRDKSINSYDKSTEIANAEHVEDTDSSLNDEGCTFFRVSYQLFFTVMVYLNYIRSNFNMSTKIDGLDDTFYPEVIYVLTIIRTFLWQTTLHNDPNYLMTVSKILPLINIRDDSLGLLISKKTLTATKHVYDHLRTIHVAMNELNSFGIEHCHPAKHNFLFFNNINLLTIGSLKSVYDEMNISLNTMNERTNSVSSTRLSKVNFCIKTLYDAVKEFVIVDDFISVYWNGNYRKLTYIFKYLTSCTVNSSNLFEFRDIVLKCTFAIIHYFLQKCFHTKHRSAIDIYYSEVRKITNKYFLDNKYLFSYRYNSVIRELQKYGDPNSTIGSDEESIKEIGFAFNAIGVSVNINCENDLLKYMDYKDNLHPFMNFAVDVAEQLLLDDKYT